MPALHTLQKHIPVTAATSLAIFNLTVSTSPNLLIGQQSLTNALAISTITSADSIYNPANKALSSLLLIELQCNANVVSHAEEETPSNNTAHIADPEDYTMFDALAEQEPEMAANKQALLGAIHATETKRICCLTQHTPNRNMRCSLFTSPTYKNTASHNSSSFPPPWFTCQALGTEAKSNQ
ncbi:hypothetical protein PHYBLDRAFT_151253 [Phycomyces blakesleeanus NRRL 1555(-)]|uniref:Uncharacterized protein n=1 Tax=Phycomyces blakesleeanus (strain ATCC 8743b / DSM 1359 / FGSC 10004 / NBRC 33097 / NRRL 1555) TaxID=763407 RepID=A0A167KC17_PHYB8|nr:hypothetical protein PHYBLDRAFT_151253 [Phycomyces blakesleeanus NRRL 1555(-)]OAD67726.1 hypothetical protein PHYBLDRAFT_151253 [Phycomyces blakesleeanus NRRL 1555(-)]|eukprot:XP_018285766.1 hypothetical protein PHYBLDRAFT_151253 [Phycomyces blakesleeanus NRRL 1555(-)]